MTRPLRPRRTTLLFAAAAALAIAVPVLAAAPSDGPPGQVKQDKPEKGPEVATTVTGTVEQGTDEKGRPTFTMTVDGTVWELSAGPKWFWGANNPLAAFAGSSVEITGTYREGGTDLDVETVNGERLRPEGRPDWAGGPREVGESHPGWKAWMSEGKPGNGNGRDKAPGQNKATPSDDAG
jgi:hypothetical protein